MKKLIAIVIIIFLFSTLLKAQQVEQQQVEETNKQAEEEAKKAEEEKNKKIADAQMQMKVNTIVTNWYNEYNGYLPTYRDEWVGFTEIPKEYWYMVKEAMQQLGYTYASVWGRINYWSNRVCHTGFFKSEFDDIRDELEKRTKW